MQRTALVAAYVDAIERARKNGWTWNDILSVIPDEVASTREQLRHAYLRAVRRIKKGKLDPDQIPLPQARSSGLAPQEQPAGANPDMKPNPDTSADDDKKTEQQKEAERREIFKD